MRTVHVKFDLPYNWSSIRKLGLYFDSLSKETIMTKQSRSFEIDNTPQSLKVKLDFWKSKIEIQKGNEELYITISVKGDNPVQWYLHGFTPRGLKIETVLKSDFDAFENQYSQTTIPIKELDSVSFILTAVVLAYLMFRMFSAVSVSEDTSQLIWASTIISTTMLLVLWKDRKLVSKSSYKSRMILNSVFLFVVVVSLSVQGFLAMGWLVALLPIVVFMRTLVFENENLKGMIAQ